MASKEMVVHQQRKIRNIVADIRDAEKVIALLTKKIEYLKEDYEIAKGIKNRMLNL